MANQGNYDHPAYLTRQMFAWGKTTAGNAGTSLIYSPPSAIRLRNVIATIVTAGTSATTGNKLDIFVGTSSVGSITLGTAAANTTGTSSDLNTLVAAGSNMYLKNGTDATGVALVMAEIHIDPATGTWS